MKKLVLAGAMVLASTVAHAADGTVEFGGEVPASCSFSDATAGKLKLNGAGNVLEAKDGDSAKITANVTGGRFQVFVAQNNVPTRFANNVEADFEVKWGRDASRGTGPVLLRSGVANVVGVDLKATAKTGIFKASNNYKATVTLTCDVVPAAPAS